MSESAMPEDPMTAMAIGAASTHEMFLGYVTAGFNEAQALALVQTILTAIVMRYGQG